MSPSTDNIFETRRQTSVVRLESLKERIQQAADGVDLAGLSVFTVGSYGRLEASEYSDIDLFFIYDKVQSTRRTNEFKFFGRLIEVVEDMGFPPLSNDAQFLQSHVISDVLESLGGPSDDAQNHFTMRMLLLLESRPVYGDASYRGVIEDIVDSYYRDYPNHEQSFRPSFLLNDIMRFWKTLLLNYEHKRNRPVDNASDPKPRVKNFKLKFSRATTCFATICALGSETATTDASKVVELVSITPQERLARVALNMPATADAVSAVLDEYAWFLEQTALPTEQLQEKFMDSKVKAQMFDRATEYRNSLYSLLKVIDERGDGQLVRSLVL